jgi:hypothetical protein
MKRTRTITVNGKSGLNLKVTFTLNTAKAQSLIRQEQNDVLEAVTDHLYQACLRDVPYHTIHASDVTLT